LLLACLVEMGMGGRGWSAGVRWSSGVGQLLGVWSPGWVLDGWGERKAAGSWVWVGKGGGIVGEGSGMGVVVDVGVG
jgi:hypothetical protein